jgi:hypothetical protein
MDIKKALEVIKAHNEWRTSPLPTDLLAMQDPSEITKALDVAITVLANQLKKPNKE